MKIKIELELPTETISVKECRESLIQLRNNALEQGEMGWATSLSHCIAWFSKLDEAGVEGVVTS